MRIRVVSKNGLFSRDFRSHPNGFEYAPGYVFTSDPACVDYDWLVVFDDLKAEELVGCPRARTILATWEPVCIKNYCRAFTRQFGHLLTNRPYAAERHPHHHEGRGYYPWFNGRSYDENKNWASPEKTELISAVCSAKAMRWTRHHDRIRLLRELVKEIPEAVWGGHGVKDFRHKNELLDAYRYHVVFENFIGPHYWTEKLADAFLCECLPFYAGAPDLADDFPAESFIPIPPDNPKKAISIIREAIAADEWTKRLPAIRQARERLFATFNFWAQVIRVIEESRNDETPSAPSDAPFFLHSRKWLRGHSLSANLEDGWFHFRQYMSGIGLWQKAT